MDEDENPHRVANNIIWLVILIVIIFSICRRWGRSLLSLFGFLAYGTLYILLILLKICLKTLDKSIKILRRPFVGAGGANNAQTPGPDGVPYGGPLPAPIGLVQDTADSQSSADSPNGSEATDLSELRTFPSVTRGSVEVLRLQQYLQRVFNSNPGVPGYRDPLHMDLSLAALENCKVVTPELARSFRLPDILSIIGLKYEKPYSSRAVSLMNHLGYSSEIGSRESTPVPDNPTTAGPSGYRSPPIIPSFMRRTPEQTAQSSRESTPSLRSPVLQAMDKLSGRVQDLRVRFSYTNRKGERRTTILRSEPTLEDIEEDEVLQSVETDLVQLHFGEEEEDEEDEEEAGPTTRSMARSKDKGKGKAL
ncbi:MAG: hypothetical protein M1821_000457 [Bathelium mastoideum]|nr:MAG: hypothetical protein M1821_000457 [Bathelium mastoideum]